MRSGIVATSAILVVLKPFSYIISSSGIKTAILTQKDINKPHLLSFYQLDLIFLHSGSIITRFIAWI